ncbi:MAG: vitamin B12 dependent-methionine synthase activation domain-containing protein [Candidatus Omnitrophota bacterium]|jgi:hypothetical protein
MIKIERTIDWDWVKKELCDKERIKPGSCGGAGDAVLAYSEEAMKKAASLVCPDHAAAKRKVLHIGEDYVELEGNIRFSGKRLPPYMNGASEICIFLVTIGSALEQEASTLMAKGDYLRGYLLDRVGSFAVESLAISAEKALRDAYAKEDKSVSIRMSPGYCDWPIEEQAALAKILDFSSIRVSLTERFMMKPKKTISAVVAVGAKGVFNSSRSQCGICDMKDCGYRRGNA